MSDPLWKSLLGGFPPPPKPKSRPALDWHSVLAPPGVVPPPETIKRLPPVPARLGLLRPRPPLHLNVSRVRVRASINKAVQGDIVSAARVLPDAETVGLAEGRQLRSAILYADLRGFSDMVIRSPKRSTLVILDTFVVEMTRLVSAFRGEVVDCAGDRILAAFWRPASNTSVQPIHDAVTCGLWMQTVMFKVILPELANKGYKGLTCGVGIDYGPVVVARVGIRNRNKLVFLGAPAVYAAKLEDWAAPGGVLMSPLVYEYRPQYLTEANNWIITPYSAQGPIIGYKCNQIFSGEEPPQQV